MIVIDDVIVSDEIVTEHFHCNLKACHGDCCVEGDEGAPLEEYEIGELEDVLDEVKPYMLPEGRSVVEEFGVFSYGIDGEYVTPLMNDEACAFVYFEYGTAYCAIEKAYLEGKINFQKPISCHLYPIRIKKYPDYDAVNYHRWPICKPAILFGKEKGTPIYKFVREPLIRKYGQHWYNRLVKEAAKIE
jgi:hypothetical protein